MTEFWIICGLLLAVALVFVVWPLWRGAVKGNGVVRDAANLEILRDQMAEMDADVANGLLTQEAYEQGKRELQARLLDEVKAPGSDAAAAARNPLKALSLAVAIVVPLTSVALYGKLGNQNALLPQEQRVGAEAFSLALTESALKELQDKVAKAPQDPNGWVMLARSLAQMERYSESVKAYDQLAQLVPNEAEVWAEYADTLVMANGKSFAGKPTELLDRALAIDPANQKALALSGMAAMERRDYATTIRNWQAVLQQMPDKESEEAKMLAQGIQMAHDGLMKQRGGKLPPPTIAAAPKAAAPGKERISGRVMLSEALRGKADQNDTVFILARAENGPPMPLAVMRKQVKDLPMQFALDDQMAMTPQAKLSNFNRVVLVARISKSGNPMPQPGDLQGAVSAVKPGSDGIKVVIDTVVQ